MEHPVEKGREQREDDEIRHERILPRNRWREQVVKLHAGRPPAQEHTEHQEGQGVKHDFCPHAQYAAQAEFRLYHEIATDKHEDAVAQLAKQARAPVKHVVYRASLQVKVVENPAGIVEKYNGKHGKYAQELKIALARLLLW